MPVVVRLQRGGRPSLPAYSIVVADSRRHATKKFIERLGFYLPKARGSQVGFSINAERLTHWVANGAQVSDTVARLIAKAGVGPEKVHAHEAKRKARRIKAQAAIAKAKADRDAKKAAKDAAPAAEAAAETPAA